MPIGNAVTEWVYWRTRYHCPNHKSRRCMILLQRWGYGSNNQELTIRKRKTREDWAIHLAEDPLDFGVTARSTNWTKKNKQNFQRRVVTHRKQEEELHSKKRPRYHEDQKKFKVIRTQKVSSNYWNSVW